MLFSINCFNFNTRIKNNKEAYKMLITINSTSSIQENKEVNKMQERVKGLSINNF